MKPLVLPAWKTVGQSDLPLAKDASADASVQRASPGGNRDAVGGKAPFDHLDDIGRTATVVLDEIDVLAPDVEGSRRLRVPSFTGYDSDVINVHGLASRESRAFMSMLAGSVPPFCGVYKLANHDLQQMEPVSRRAFLLRFVGKSLGGGWLLPHLSLQANVAISLLFNDVPRGDAMDLADDELLRLGLARWAHRLPHELPSFAYRLGLIAKALVHQPLLMLFELPKAELSDEQAAIVGQRLWRAAHLWGTCIFMSTADDRLASLAHRTLWFRGDRSGPGEEA